MRRLTIKKIGPLSTKQNQKHSSVTWVSIAGLLVTLFAAIISLSNLYLFYNQQERDKERVKREQPNLIVSSNAHNNYFFQLKNREDNWDAKNRIAIFAQLENLSEKPITITRFDLNTDIGTFVTTSSIEAEEKSYEIYRESTSRGYTATTLPLGKRQLKPITILEPWGAKDGYIFFVTNEDIPVNELKGTLIVKTTRGEFKTQVNIWNSEWYHSKK